MGTLAFVVLLVSGVGWVYLRLGGNINTFGADGISGDRPPGNASGSNVLVIGSDSRAGGNKGLGGGEGDIGRSDTAFLLHVYGDGKHAVAVSVPRDTLVDVPPCRLPDGEWTEEAPDTMFNSAFSVGETEKGNPACTQNTVEKLTGLRVDHTVVVDFEGFARMTSAVGGVQVCLPKDIYQRDLSPNRGSRGDLLFPAGLQTVEGQKALDYVRLRHGIGDGSDIGRIKRQQAFVASLIKKVKSGGLNPTTLLPLANAATKSMTVDPGLGSADKMISFAMSMKGIDLHNTKFVTIPWRYEGERVAVVEPDADRLWASLKADRPLGSPSPTTSATASPSPSASVSGEGIVVAVYNGTLTKGLAAKAAVTLRASGFTVGSVATARSQDHATTLVEYGPGEKEHAKTVAALFPDARLEATTGAGLSLVLGGSYGTTPAPAASDKARSADDNPCSNLTFG
ncbi:LCP family protein [Streptomyces sp. NBC_01465]|uniref:LCP family protein n=1 Tax=Streptomyces sp. NBC_01465 TaxID=2903878 RepID=UPI002E31883B|nr:LCP family protein [Streptomyces sp. NBC_01465]